MKPGTNPDRSLWSVAQWKDHARTQLAKESLSPVPKLEKAIREGFARILEAPDTFTPEQMNNLSRYMAASVMAVATSK